MGRDAQLAAGGIVWGISGGNCMSRGNVRRCNCPGRMSAVNICRGIFFERGGKRPGNYLGKKLTDTQRETSLTGYTTR